MDIISSVIGVKGKPLRAKVLKLRQSVKGTVTQAILFQDCGLPKAGRNLKQQT